MHKPLRDRLIKKILLEPYTGCWVFVGCRLPSGYGRIKADGERKEVLAHRASWQVHKGAIPDGMCVLHRCDNPPCINPDHLFLGTFADNYLDMVSKGRARCASEQPKTRGSKHWKAKLTETQVREIIARKSESRKSLASEFGTSARYISSIVCGHKWKYLR